MAGVGLRKETWPPITRVRGRPCVCLRVCVGVRVCAYVCADMRVPLLPSPLHTGELRLLDDLERIAFNALPGTMTADMWQHQYLQQANEISACKANPHVWQSDGPDSTLFGACGGRPGP